MDKYQASKCLHCPIRSKIYCSCLDVENLKDLSDKAKHETFDKKVIILSSGNEINSIYNILDGIIKVYQLNEDGNQQIIGFLYPGDFFGSHEGGQYQFFAETVSQAKLCKIPIKKFRMHLSKNAGIRDKFYEATTNELSLAREHINILTKNSAEQKVLDFIRMISLRQHKMGQPINPVHLIMPRIDIANYLGLRLETVSRAFTKLKANNSISLNNFDSIIINNAIS
ncbi:MAG: Crp/Fnr family transcriptional regulator [Gammaproteobacteria bacterium]|nr:Crp/Fnr family transcriptional regulator [Gammaproteobacteria bacterium]